tara:strand:+ start:212 stop:634 length:423 start_codon:yes stop_codon:yes gene_type:complete
MSTWATPTDVIDRWVGDNAPTDTDQIQLLIDDAEVIILGEYPSIQTRIDDGDLSALLVSLVVVRMVTRLMRNPENLTYWQMNAGPFGQGRTFGDQRDIWLTADEMNMLAPNRRGKAFEIDLAPNAVAPVIEDTVWKDYVF